MGLNQEWQSNIRFNKFTMQDQEKSKAQLIRELTDLRQQIVEFEELKVKLQRTELALRRAQKLEVVGQLAGGVAHNFNNMLTAIMGYVGLSLNELPPDHPITSDLEGIQKTAQRAAKLTQQLLNLTRNQDADARIVNLNDLVLEMDTLLRRLIHQNIEYIYSPTVDLGQVKVDPTQFEQVLVNLVVNARDAMPNGGKLRIETANISINPANFNNNLEIRPGNYIMLAVSDTGSGMTEEIKGQVFEPFFTTKEAGKGTGLGLAICYGIIKQNSGYILVTSAPGQGTTFKVYLPRVDEPPENQVITHLRQQPLQGAETILLVEDEFEVRNLAARVLRGQGYQVLEAADGEEGLNIARKYSEQTVHLLVTNVNLPRLTKGSLPNQLKKIFPHLKILFISGHSSIGIIQQDVDPTIYFLAKPFAPDLLLRRVREVLDNNIEH